VLSYWHVLCYALRTFKAEIGYGITEEAQQRATRSDCKWQISGNAELFNWVDLMILSLFL